MIENRRNFLRGTLLSGTALLAVGRALADICAPIPSQAKGPFIPDDFPFRERVEGHPYIMTRERDADLTQSENGQGAAGQVVYFRGQVVDENCLSVPDATVFLWQADDQGHYNHSEDPNIQSEPDPSVLLDPGFQYRGSVTTDANGGFQFKTIKPKYYPLDPKRPDFKRTAHLHIGIMKRGFHDLFTQAYFEGDALEDIGEIRRLNRIDILLGA